MNRRQFVLATGGIATAGLAGCLTPAQDQPPAPDSGGTSGGTSLAFVVGATGATGLPDAIDYTVTVENDDLTQGPPRFAVALANTAADQDYAFADDRDAFYFGAVSGDYGLFPASVFDDSTYERPGAVWDATEEYVRSQEFRTETLPAGETRSASVLLLRVPSQAGSGGEYPDAVAFETEFRLSEGTADVENGTPVTLSFDLDFTTGQASDT